MARRPGGAAPRAVARRVAAMTLLQAQLRVELLHVKPLVWRRVLVPETITLPKLHLVLQWAMGWANSHLHEYEIARRRYGMLDDEWEVDDPPIDERRVRLKPLIEDGLRRFTYLYDFGDHWEHRVVVEDLLMPKAGAPLITCTAGENACPPEGVGSTSGYADFLDIIADPSHEEHKDTLRWVGGAFDPTAFSVADANERLASIKP